MTSVSLRADFCPDQYLNDVQDIPRAFIPYLTLDENSDHFLRVRYVYKKPNFYVFIITDIWGAREASMEVDDADVLEYKRKTKRFIKNVLYDFLSEELQIKLPYGSLTGVRPTKLYYELDKKIEYPRDFIVENYRVSQEKADLIARCVENQKKYKNMDPKSIGLFVNIPFCPTKCKYCSFISTEVFRIKNSLPDYVDCVRREIENAFEICAQRSFTVRSVYFGGGTPTCIGPDSLRSIFSSLSSLKVECTVEAGRPDAISSETLDVLRACGVTRVSVNPQTLHDETLRAVGRAHSVDDFYRAYELVDHYGFSINTDLIAGLPGESLGDFIESVDGCIALAPDNITIHSLSLKRGSVFTAEGMEKNTFGAVAEMIRYGHQTLNSHGYVPYYMYRQKNTADNLENTGYTKPGKQCLYNIDMMEESASVIGIGAGSMSKLVDGNLIKRFSSPKGFREYVERIDEVLSRKKFFFVN